MTSNLVLWGMLAEISIETFAVTRADLSPLRRFHHRNKQSLLPRCSLEESLGHSSSGVEMRNVVHLDEVNNVSELREQVQILDANLLDEVDCENTRISFAAWSLR